MTLRLAILFSALIYSLVLACGTADEAPAESSSADEVVADEVVEEPTEAPVVDENEVVTIGDRAELRGTTRPSGMFSVDDFIEAGWKKNKEFDLDTLPEAEGAFFGFYNRKDIELRIYPSHEVAMAAGRDAAETAIETEKLSGRGAGFTAVTLYGAYLVAGNVVMLCEISVQDCVDLIEQVPE